MKRLLLLVSLAMSVAGYAQNHSVKAVLAGLSSVGSDYNSSSKFQYDKSYRLVALDTFEKDVTGEDADMETHATLSYSDDRIEGDITVQESDDDAVKLHYVATLEDGRITHEVYTMDGSTVYDYTYSYDAQGNLASILTVSPDDWNFTLETTWEHGNMTKAVATSPGGDHETTYFEFTYSDVMDETPVQAISGPLTLIGYFYGLSSYMPFLYCQNYYGNMCKQLVVYRSAHMVFPDVSPNDYPTSLVYQFEGDRVSQLKWTDEWWDEPEFDNYTFTWDSSTGIAAHTVSAASARRLLGLDGRRMKRLKGLRLVQGTDGTVRKVMSK